LVYLPLTTQNYFAYTVYLYVSNDSYNKEPLYPHTILLDWPLWWPHNLFSARYELYFCTKRGSGCWPPVTYRVGPALVPGQCMWVLWWTK